MFNEYLRLLEQSAGAEKAKRISDETKLFELNEDPIGRLTETEIYLPFKSTAIETLNCLFHITKYPDKFDYNLLRKEKNPYYDFQKNKPIGENNTLYGGILKINNNNNDIDICLDYIFSSKIENYQQNIIENEKNKGKVTSISELTFLASNSPDDKIISILSDIKDCIVGNLFLIERIMDSNYFIIEKIPLNIKKNFKKALRKHQRPSYTYMKLKDIRVRYKLGLNKGTGGEKHFDYRRSHPRTFRDEKFTFMRGKTIIIPEKWWGDRETTIANKHYRVVLDA